MALITRPWTQGLIAALVLATVLATRALYPEVFSSGDTTDSAPVATSAYAVERGAYLARIGNCAGCHTARDGAALAGGRGIDTPFGIVYSSNLTSDSTYGLGAWSAQDFWNAMHHGLARDGSVLNPAFPYTSYTRITRDDSDALFAFLKTVAPSATVRKPNTIAWPLSSQLALRAWRALYFTVATPTSSAPEATGGEGAALARGDYLVNGLGHCSECHTQRNGLGGPSRLGTSSGGVMPHSQWFAPALQGAAQSNRWSTSDLATLLRVGSTAQRSVGGPMAEVVLRSTQYLTEADAHAMALYLTSAASREAAQYATPTPVATSPSNPRGAQLYEKHCEECHGKKGVGVPNAYPALAGNPAVNRAEFNNLALKVLRGGFAPATAANPRPFGMPPYMLTLNEADVAAVLTHIRSSWGNQGSSVSEFDINRLKASIHP
jgi:mono/diheme cytochrome c family protein